MGLIKFEWCKDDRGEKILFEGTIGKEKDIDLLSSYNWNEDPFKQFNRLPDNLLVGRNSEKLELKHFIDSQSNFGIIKGCGGSGKTTLLKWIYNRVKEENQLACYVSAKKSMYDDFYKEIFKELKLQFSIFDKKEFTSENLYKLFKRSLKNKKFFIIIDDYEDLSKKNQKNIQQLFKAFDNMKLIVSFNFEVAKEIDISSFGNITFNLDISKFPLLDSFKIIEKRMNYVGVNETSPLTQVMIKNLAEKSDYVLQDFLILCERKVKLLYHKGDNYNPHKITAKTLQNKNKKKLKTKYEGDIIINELLDGEAEFDEI